MWKGRRKLNQAGMSLVELVVVILIIGILSVGSGVGMAYVSRMNATGAAEKLVSMLDKTRVMTLSSGGTVALELVCEDDTYYAKLMQNGVEAEKLKLGNAALTITVKNAAGVETPIGPGSCTFSYNKSNGAFAAGCTYTSIEIEGSQTKVIQLVTATGRCYSN